MRLEDYLAVLTGLVDDDGQRFQRHEIFQAARFQLPSVFELEILLHRRRFKEKDAPKFHRVEYDPVPALRHGE